GGWGAAATGGWVLRLIAGGLGLPIADAVEPLLPASTIFLVIVVLVAWYGRLAPGLLAACCATLMMDYFFIEPIYTLDLSSKVSSALVVFALSAIVVGWASANRRRAQDELKRARDETEQKVI